MNSSLDSKNGSLIDVMLFEPAGSTRRLKKHYLFTATRKMSRPPLSEFKKKALTNPEVF